ncbi:hypothetical protein J8F10_30080 [Gemmata sp. G18]|uniref:Uncharacterized protein n=1 Tax=Gemmata palustris TaxID=2822762 RepID=A0ABS5C0J4_9BACT|nr:hypothetical protein [Gemmata palustris]MBP3959514.1 hypothetical protein [Gemmata palustris]
MRIIYPIPLRFAPLCTSDQQDLRPPLPNARVSVTGSSPRVSPAAAARACSTRTRNTTGALYGTFRHRKRAVIAHGDTFH